MKQLYHGSHIQGLKEIKPQKSGGDKKYVYAISELAFALLFSVPVRNTLLSSSGRLADGTPYFCEKGPGIFDLLYKDKSSSIYVLNGKNFFQKERLWKEEYVSEQCEEVVEEIQIVNVQEYLLDLQKKGEFKMIPYEDRKKYFPNIDETVLQDVMKMVDKYGKEKTFEDIKKWRPEILEEVILRLKK